MPLKGKIVLYGGSFDPPHMGHALAIQWMRQALRAKEVIVFPAAQHADGKAMAPFAQRMKMCELMVAPLGKQVTVCDMEETMPKPNRTVNLVERWACANLAVAIGSDLVDDVWGWERWSDIEKMADIVVIGRSDSLDVIPDRWLHYPINISNISSSQIRERIRNGLSITGMVPKSIDHYLKSEFMRDWYHDNS